MQPVPIWPNLMILAAGVAAVVLACLIVLLVRRRGKRQARGFPVNKIDQS